MKRHLIAGVSLVLIQVVIVGWVLFGRQFGPFEFWESAVIFGVSMALSVLFGCVLYLGFMKQ